MARSFDESAKTCVADSWRPGLAHGVLARNVRTAAMTFLLLLAANQRFENPDKRPLLVD
jgi:hypothetical protein